MTPKSDLELPRNATVALACAGLGLPLGAYAYLGLFSRYAGDDYCTAGQLVEKGLLGMQVELYRAWSGRFSFTFVVGLVELLGPNVVVLLPALALTVWVVVLAWLVTRVPALTGGWPPALIGAALSLAIVYATMSSTPDLGQSLLWQTGMLTYVLPLILMTVLAGLVLSRVHAGRAGWPSLVAAGLLALVAGGTSETSTALATAALTAGIVLVVLAGFAASRSELVVLGGVATSRSSAHGGDLTAGSDAVAKRPGAHGADLRSDSDAVANRPGAHGGDLRSDSDAVANRQGLVRREPRGHAQRAGHEDASGRAVALLSDERQHEATTRRPRAGELSPSSRVALALLVAALVGAVLALAILLAAPGNAVRGSGHAPSLGFAVTAALDDTRQFLHDWWRFTPSSAAVAFLIPAGVALLDPAPRAARRSVLAIGVIVAAVGLALIVVALMPSFYALGAPQPGRARVIPQYLIALVTAVLGYTAGAGIRSLWPTAASMPIVVGGCAVLGLALIFVGPLRSTLSSVAMATNARTYATRWDQIDERLRTARVSGTFDAQVPSLTLDGTIRGMDFLSRDASDWLNVCAARYYGLRSIRAE